MPDPDLDALHVRLDALRAALVAEYGWTHLALRSTPTRDHEGRLRATLELATLALAPRVRALLHDLPCTLVLQPLPVRSWHALLAPCTPVLRHHPALARSELSTELQRDDGPVALVWREGEHALVRARDATQGWIRDPLGPPCPARPLARPRLPPDPAAALLAAARSYLGTPYRLGGATHARIDCSALVQRAFVEALDVLLPKNSNDQLAAIGSDPAAPIEPGDLLFIHSRRERRTHVGLAGERDTVVQASRSRSAVVEIPRDEYMADAASLTRVSLARVLVWAAAQAGKPALELPPR